MTSPQREYRFPLSIQIALSERFDDRAFHDTCALLCDFGFSGVELNIVDPGSIVPGQLVDILSDYQLKMTMFATGMTAKNEQLSLSNANEKIRQQSIKRCLDFIEFASYFSAGIIVGFLKGGPTEEKIQARDDFRRSLGYLLPHAECKSVPLLVEATNRYESAVANTLNDAFDLIREFNSPFVRILPDTFHMNIEECNLFGSLTQFRPYYQSIHLSDNNRYFPGLGGMPFRSILRFLHDIDYQGGLVIEGNLLHDFRRDLEISMALLSPSLSTSSLSRIGE